MGVYESCRIFSDIDGVGQHDRNDRSYSDDCSESSQWFMVLDRERLDEHYCSCSYFFDYGDGSQEVY